jgi:hypothetical protein
MPEEYKQKIMARKELANLVDSIEFVPLKDKLISEANNLILAIPPKYSALMVLQGLPALDHLFLEKPLGSNITEHKDLIESLSDSEQSFSIAYLFPYTSWFSEILRWQTLSSTSVNIQWELPFPTDSWKMNDQDGGGILNFYGIHFLALLNSQEDLVVSISSSERTLIMGVKLPRQEISISISESMENKFLVQIQEDEKNVFHFQDEGPLGKRGQIGFPDPRVPLLASYLSDSVSKNILEKRIELERRILKVREAASLKELEVSF